MIISRMASTRSRSRRAACAVFTLLIAAAFVPAAGAEEPAAEKAESRTFRFSPEGGKEIVITPKQKARREERRARRKARHAAEAEARKQAAASGAKPAPGAAPAGSDAAAKPVPAPAGGASH